MKKFYLSLALAVFAMTAVGQSKISLSGRLFLEEIKNPVKVEMLGKEAPSVQTMGAGEKQVTKTKILGALVRLKSGYTAADIESAGYEVTSNLGKVVVVKVGSDEVENLAELDAVKTVDFGKKHQLFMNNVRYELGANDINSGFEYNGRTHAYTGKGVVTGIYDTGVHANHISFLDADGKSRVQKLWHYYYKTNEQTKKEEGYVSTYPTPEVVLENFTTDDDDETHGTHTTGIMAGGYTGNALWVDYDNALGDFSISEGDQPNPYKGMCTESDIAIGCGDLSDGFVIDGMSRIVEYAKEEGKPVVINYSAGSNIGPHDGTDAFSEALSELAQDAIICVAAGNSGDENMSFRTTGTTTYKTTLLGVTSGSGIFSSKVFQGYIDFWASDDQPFKVEFITISSRGAETVVLTIDKALDDVVSKSSSSYAVQALSEVDKGNNRFNVLSYVQTSYSSLSTTKFGVRVTPSSASQTVYATINGVGTFDAQSLSGYKSGNPELSISNESCCPDVISVGAYINRNKYADLAFKVHSYNQLTVGDIIPFSSYGTTFDGRTLPDVAAPGLSVVSAYSTPYIDKGSVAADSIGAMSAGVVADGKRYLWGQMSGTSMAAPAVAGTVGLWLEANPNLTVEDVKDIIKLSSTKVDGDANSRFGAGKINALAGIKEALRMIGTAGVEVTDRDLEKQVIVECGDGTLTVFAGGATGFDVKLYSMDGRMAQSVKATGDEVTMQTSSLAKGVYVVTVTTPQGTVSNRVLVK